MPGNLSAGDDILRICPHQQPALFLLMSSADAHHSEQHSSIDEHSNHTQLPQCDWGALSIDHECHQLFSTARLQEHDSSQNNFPTTPQHHTHISHSHRIRAPPLSFPVS